MAQSGWLLSAFFVVAGCSIPVSDFSPPTADAADTDTSTDGSIVDSGEIEGGDLDGATDAGSETCSGSNMKLCPTDAGMVCTNLRTNENCGSCGNACKTGESCKGSGACH